MSRRHIYCVLCCRSRQCVKYAAVERFAHYAAAFVPNPACLRVQRLCPGCTRQLTEPYEIVVDDATVIPLVHVTSRVLTPEHTGISQKIAGLLALAPVPAGALLPYPGQRVADVDYARFKAVFDAELSHEWARGGLKDSGVPNLLLGQFAKAAPRHCAHFVNSVDHTDISWNCTWEHVRIDETFLARYPALPISREALGQLYPCIRVATPIPAGGELLLRTYGPTFWSRMDRERAGVVRTMRPRALNARMQRVLAGDDQVRQQRRGGYKRARDE